MLDYWQILFILGLGIIWGISFFYLFYYFVDFFVCDFKLYFNIEVCYIKVRKEYS